MTSANDRNYPYHDAPRLPETPLVLGPGALLRGDEPIELELGPGRGSFILERLEHDPRARIIGLEIRRKWATLVDRRLGERGLHHRGRVFAEDARTALPRLQSGCVSRIYVHFPDPWWKKRHHKRLLAQDSLVEHAARLLRVGGDFFVQTDVEERAERYEALFGSHPAFRPWAESARVSDPEFGARSPREKRAIEDGLPILRLRFRRV